MKKSSSEPSLFNFHRTMNRDIDLLMKIETARSVVKSLEAKRSIFDAFVFHICAKWEILVEDLLLDCLNKDTSRYAEYTGFNLPKHISRETCKAIIIGLQYFDFKSVGDLKKMSNQMLTPLCNPFAKITSAQAKKIDEFFTIRNYLAHRSYKARRSLLKVYQDTYGMRNFVEPGTFLLAREKGAQIPRMGAYINNFKDTANMMGKFLGVPWI